MRFSVFSANTLHSGFLYPGLNPGCKKISWPVSPGSHAVRPMNHTIQGIPASPGMALGPATVIRAVQHMIPRKHLNDAQIIQELERFEQAIQKSRSQMESLLNGLPENDDLRNIFEMQLLLLEDPMLIDESREKIRNRAINAEQALVDEISILKAFLLKTNNQVFQERASDLEDMGNRILSNLMNVPEGDIRIPLLQDLPPNTILVASDVSPSLMLHIREVGGIAVQGGGITGHMAILAKSRNIPALVSCEGILDFVKDHQTLLVDAVSGICMVEPGLEFQKTYHDYIERNSREKETTIQSPILTQDGVKIHLWSNLSDRNGANDIRVQGTSGVGLFRTEFLYLKDAQLFNNPQRQKEIYTQILNDLNGKPITFRLLDVSDDKPIPVQAMVRERHLRGIQFLLANPYLVRSQLRAIMEAAVALKSPAGQVRLMIPMVAMLEEVSSLQEIYLDVRAEVVNDLGIEFKDLPRMDLGIMIETPAAIMMLPELGEISDFFSIGSNDLAQLTLGLPRDNPTLTKENLFFQPAIYRLLKQVVDQTHKPLALCGEIGSRTDIIPLLIGLGIRNLSVAPSSLVGCANAIQKLSLEECQAMTRTALKTTTAEELHRLLTNFIPA